MAIGERVIFNQFFMSHSDTKISILSGDYVEGRVEYFFISLMVAGDPSELVDHSLGSVTFIPY
jgi:hypothetical protein